MSMAAPVAQRERGAGTAVLASQRDEHVVAVDRAAPFEREQGRVQRRVADLPAGQYAAAGDVLHQLRIGLVPGGQVGEPQLPALVGVGWDELDCDVDATQERRVDAASRVGGDDHDAVEGLQPLQQEVGLQVGVPVVGVADLGTAGHQRVALVEQQQDVELLGPGEDAVEVAFGLTYVLVDHGGQIDAVDVEVQPGRQMARGERLAGTARSAEQGADAAVDRTRPGAADVGSEALALAATGQQGRQLASRGGTQHRRRTGGERVEPGRKGFQGLPLERAGRGTGISRSHQGTTLDGRRSAGQAPGPVDVARREPEGLHELLLVARCGRSSGRPEVTASVGGTRAEREADRKSTRLNSSHGSISYAVFCLKKKKKTTTTLYYIKKKKKKKKIT